MNILYVALHSLPLAYLFLFTIIYYRFNDSESGSDSIDTQSIASSFMSASESVFADDLYDTPPGGSPRTRPDDTKSQVSFYR